MGDEIFKEGGPHNTKRTSPGHFSMTVTIPNDSDGMRSRECPSVSCSPAYFKVRPGTGVTGPQTLAYCPYCRHHSDPSDFNTKAQIEYAKQVVAREALGGIDNLIKDSLELGPSGTKTIDGGLFSLEISYKPLSRPPVPRPSGEELRRDLVCPKCGLDHAVFGIATWCPDCGADIFLTHVVKEYDVVQRMLADVDNRRERLGSRVAARDIENALEDTVSIFEAVLRAMTRRLLLLSFPAPDVEDILRKRVANKYQNIDLARDVALNELKVDLFASISSDDLEFLKSTFEKRHPITHNLGIVDRKYLEKAQSGELQGREVRVTPEEVSHTIDLCLGIIRDIYPRVFPPAANLSGCHAHG